MSQRPGSRRTPALSSASGVAAPGVVASPQLSGTQKQSKLSIVADSPTHAASPGYATSGSVVITGSGSGIVPGSGGVISGSDSTANRKAKSPSAVIGERTTGSGWFFHSLLLYIFK